jgi:ABC-type nitrate/sulfonate/bicarbonate transport system substrate-binding protein
MGDLSQLRILNRRSFGRLAAAGAWLSACGSRVDRGEQPLQVLTTPYITNLPIYVAHGAGYFEEAGLTVTLEEHPSGSSVVALLAGGAADASMNALHPAFFNAVAQGARVRYVAARAVASPGCPMLTLFGNRAAFPQGLEDLRRLEGRRVAVRRAGSIAEFTLDMLLRDTTLSSGDLELQFLRDPEAAAALVGGGIDAMVSTQFERDLDSLSDNVVRGPSLSDVLPGFQYSFVVFGPRMLDSDIETGVRFLLAYLRGSQDYVRRNRPEIVEQFARKHGMDLELVRQGCRDTFSRDGRIDEENLDLFVAWAVRKGYCPPGLTTELLFDTRYIDLAAPRFETEFAA